MTKAKGKGKAAAEDVSREWITTLSIILLVATLLLVAGIRIRLLGTPFERDEGEYAYAGQLMLQGSPPYAEVYNMKFPGTYAAYALIEAVLGESIKGIHLGFLVLNIATAIVLFLVGRRILGTPRAAAAGAVYALLSLSGSVVGTSAHATHFVLLPVLLGLFFLLDAVKSGRPGATFLCGCLFGAAFMMKQQAVFFAGFALVFFLWERFRSGSSTWTAQVSKAAILIAGILTPFGLTALVLWRAGVWGSFWFWTFSYAREYVSIVGPGEGIANFAQQFPGVVGPSFLIWVLAAVGLAGVIYASELRGVRRLLLLFLGFSALTVCPGLYFRSHYFVTLLPAVALLASIGACLIARGLFRGSRRPEAIALLIIVLVLGLTTIFQSGVFFRMSPKEASRAMYGLEPFPEAVEVGRWLGEQPGNSPVLVLGAEPEIYFYARRRSATGYIYVYSLWENQRYADQMVQQMTREIETARPGYVIVEFVPQRLQNWADDFLKRYYSLEGRVDMISDSQTEYRWGAEARTALARARRYLFIFKRI